MHSQSLPPSDRDESPAPQADQSLIAALAATKLSNSEIGSGIGYSPGYVSQYLNNRFPGDLATIERVIREWLRDRTIAIVSGVPTVDTEISKLMHRRLEEIRSGRDLSLIIGPAGIGKSRGASLYLLDHKLAISFRALPWRSGMNAIAEDLFRAAGIQRLAEHERRWDAIIDRTKGSGRLLIVDDAHEISQRALQCAVDYHEATDNPVCLIGLAILKKKLLADTRRARRVDHVIELKITDPKPLVEHLLDQFAPDANGSRSELIALSLQVAAGPGAFGSLEKELKLAARNRKKNPAITWPAAFRAAHQRLLRTYSLTV